MLTPDGTVLSMLSTSTSVTGPSKFSATYLVFICVFCVTVKGLAYVTHSPLFPSWYWTESPAVPAFAAFIVTVTFPLVYVAGDFTTSLSAISYLLNETAISCVLCKTYFDSPKLVVTTARISAIKTSAYLIKLILFSFASLLCFNILSPFFLSGLLLFIIKYILYRNNSSFQRTKKDKVTHY